MEKWSWKSGVQPLLDSHALSFLKLISCTLNSNGDQQSTHFIVTLIPISIPNDQFIWEGISIVPAVVFFQLITLYILRNISGILHFYDNLSSIVAI